MDQQRRGHLLWWLLAAVFCFLLAVLHLFWHDHLSGWGAFYYNAIAYGILSKEALIYYFRNGCLLSNPYYVRPRPFSPSPEDCYLCEATESVDTLYNVSFDRVKLNYLDRGRPLILSDAMDSWDSMAVNVEDIAEIFLSPDLKATPPCLVDTNLNLRSSLDMAEFLKLHSFIRRSILDKWFMQW
ncbi:hypothetical protein WDU94_010350 [Cyamophila willieti]